MPPLTAPLAEGIPLALSACDMLIQLPDLFKVGSGDYKLKIPFVLMKFQNAVFFLKVSFSKWSSLLDL